jgi:phage tail sheath protein FI
MSNGVHAIAGAPTSIAAFVGWTAQGPVTAPSLVESWSQFEATFGGLDARSLLGYAVLQFFTNGGRQAYIVRLVWDATLTPAPGTSPAPAATAAGAGGGLTLFASSPGAWGDTLEVSVMPEAADPARFSLVVRQQTGAGGGWKTLESFENLSTAPSDPAFVVAVLDSASQYVSCVDPASGVPVIPAAPPSASGIIALSGGADGDVLTPASDGNFEIALISSPQGGVSRLNLVPAFNLLCVPGETDAPTLAALQAYCAAKRAVCIIDAPQSATCAALLSSAPVGTANGACYFPWVLADDPLLEGQARLFPPCGFVAGIFAATDAGRGVWKAPAGPAARLTGASGLQYSLDDAQSDALNSQAINCLRQFAVEGPVVWGARTLQGADGTGSPWTYIPVRRLALHIEASLYAGTQWALFEPNDAALWGELRLSVGAFMQALFDEGAFQGATPAEAWFVTCGAEINPPASVAAGIVNIVVGFAPLEPAEFVVIQISQLAGPGS